MAKWTILSLLLLGTVLAGCNTATSTTPPNQTGPAITEKPLEKPATSPSTASSIDLSDHQACLDKDGLPSRQEDPATEKYYRCRAKLLQEKIAAPKSVLDKISPSQINASKKMAEAAKVFEEKADLAYKAQVQARNMARQQWEQEESDKVQRFSNQDHQECSQKGYFVGKPEDPRTESYYDCRSHLAELRMTPPPTSTHYPPDRMPNAVLKFHQQADQSRNAFNARDYQDHYTCMDKGLFPGKLYDPKTAEYYNCREALAHTGLGNVVAELFQEDAAKAKKESKEHAICMAKGFELGTQAYAICRKNYTASLVCKNNIPAQVQTLTSRDKRDCNEKALLEFPSSLSHSSIQVVTKVSSQGEETRSTTTVPAKYTTVGLSKTRQGITTICMNERESTRELYKQQLIASCEKIMSEPAIPGHQK